ncbi:ATP-binding cassette sub-family G member 1-like isoform X2 [Thrips palmi]|uniref:ATP-binding cassette sub-family G member 1-like isoform X2 n=1 Tax=Thrips palmi TaxID=161013 RepID=A0A6P8YYW2_THRPL|nr:ATP-binding cassette sub-family G member 1-like isoform X2 [Thrips palmi]
MWCAPGQITFVTGFYLSALPEKGPEIHPSLTEARRILHGVSGEFRAGQLTAIMGPSGAGKSTLLDVLSGYTCWGVRGRLLVNGAPRDTRTFQRQSVYIQQDAALHPQLTVKEAMNVAAVLKLGRRGPEVQKTIVETLESLGLLSHIDTMTASLSGGQLKRLATALELLSNPPIMFFDEPTSGLDSSTTKQCVGVLRRLARQGRTVVCTIHTPSALVFGLLDQLYLLMDGRCAYNGHTANLLPYLASLGLRCPPYHNPADFALEVTSGDYGDHTAALVQASDNGRSQLWGHTSNTHSAEGALGLARRGAGRAGDADCESTVSRMSRQSSETASASVTPSEGGRGRCRRGRFNQVYPTTFWMQLYMLIRRTIKRGLRDRMLCHSRFYIHLVAGLLIGALFLDIGGDAAHVFHNFSLLFFSLMFLMFTAFSAMILAFPLEMPIIAREHFNRWYSLKSYFLAVTIADVPLQGLCTCVYTVIMYYMTSQPLEPARFIQYLLICALVSYTAQSIGLVVGAAMKVEHGVVFGPLAILPFTIFSGYFVLMKDAPSYMQWLFHASYLKYGLSGCMLAVYGYGRAPLSQCSDDYCHFKRPEKFLAETNLDGGNYWLDAVVLFVIGSALRLAAYFVLKLRLRQFRQ